MVIFRKSKAGAEQAPDRIVPHIEKKLFLRVSRDKTFTGHATKMKLLGFEFCKSKKGWRHDKRMNEVPRSTAVKRGIFKELAPHEAGWK